MKVALKRKEAPFYFEAEGDSNIAVSIDAGAAIGGKNKGVRPMELVLMGLGGCASIDLGLILKKQKQHLVDQNLSIIGKRKDTDAKEFESIDLHFKLEGDLDQKKVERAMDLTFNKYCSVAISLSNSIDINYTFEIVN